MIEIFQEFQSFLEGGLLILKNKFLDAHFKKFTYHFLNEEIDYISDLIQVAYSSKTIVIDEYVENKYQLQLNNDFFIVCFSNKCIIILKSEISQIKPFFYEKQNIFFISDTVKEDLLSSIDAKNKEIIVQKLLHNENKFFSDEVQSLYSKSSLSTQEKSQNINNRVINFYKIIRRCISGCLIAKAYNNSKIDRIFKYQHLFKQNQNEIKLAKDEYLKLRNINIGSFSSIVLIYHITREQIFVLKTFRELEDGPKLFEREVSNYVNIHHPFIPLFFGTTNNQSLIIEYLSGYSLNIIKEKLSNDDKIRIIFKILVVFTYLHQNGYIYRDLKPNNIIIDENKTMYLIDFDEMVKKESYSNDNEFTSDFTSVYVAPEIIGGYFISNKADIYSIGKLIEFLFSNGFPEKYAKLYEICHKCLLKDFEKRPCIFQLLNLVYYHFHSIISEISEIDTIASIVNINIEKYFPYLFFVSQSYHPFFLFQLGKLYEKGQYVKLDTNKAIQYFTLAANQNLVDAQFKLGTIYYVGQYIKQDINQTIKYFSLASKQGHLDAQFNLGNIYFEGKYIEKNITKAIEYFTQSAKQDHPLSNYNLGKIFYKEKYLNQDIKKAIEHFLLAVKHDLPKAQYYLGIIFYENKYVERNIDASIFYLSLSAYQNNIKAQFLLGQIYIENKYIERDINKSIEFYTMAAEQGNQNAQYNLGAIFYSGNFISQSIILAITYFEQAAKQNNVLAQYNLGQIYYENKYIPQNINKAILYYTQASNHNYADAQNELGSIYYEGKYIKQDIEEAIKYFTMAAKQNHPKALFNLGIIYLNEKYVQYDINKAISFFEQSAKQQFLLAQYYLGVIYYEDKYIKREINESIKFFNLAANQNDLNSHYYLGLIYYENKYIQRDMNKSIYHFTQAAKQGHLKSQYTLAIIFYDGFYVPRDINKTINYFSLASDQNCSEAQNFLGTIYFSGTYVSQNILKSIYYFQLAADLNNSNAQYNLGIIYYYSKYGHQDIKKAIHYFLLSSNQNPYAQEYLGIIYYESKYIPQDISKSIYYFSLASNWNHPNAQYNLGLIYYDNKFISRNIKKSIYYLQLADKNHYYKASLKLGDIYYEGKYVEKDIEKAVHYYKEASSFNDEYAKNNLGVIYKNGFENKINKNVQLAKEYFNEAIRKNNDPLSIFNLVNIYLDEKEDMSKCVDLLIKSVNKGFVPPVIVLIHLLTKNDESFDIKYLENGLEKYNGEYKIHATEMMNTYNEASKKIAFDHSKLHKIYDYYRKIHYLYIDGLAISSDILNNESLWKQMQIKETIPEINNYFYEGFGIDVS